MAPLWMSAKNCSTSREVEMVLQALAERLGNDGEIGMAARDLQQIAATKPLQPERGTLARRPTAATTVPVPHCAGNARRKGTVRQLLHNPLANIFRRDTFQHIQYRLRAIGQSNQEAVVMVQDLRAVAQPLPQTMFQGQPQAKVDSGCQGG